VPHHRILGFYFQERQAGSGADPFLGVAENEVVVIPEGIRFDYVGTISYGTEASKLWKKWTPRP
jgi:hypothetical protein